MRPSLCVVLTASLLGIAAFSSADKLHLTIQMSGTPVGECIYDQQPNGAFSSQTELRIGKIDLTGFISGHMKNGRAVDYSSISKGVGGAATTVVLKNGKIQASKFHLVLRASDPIIIV